MRTEEKTKLRTIVEKHIDKMIEEICNGVIDIDVGYYPDDYGAFADAVMVIFEHQSRINEYHCSEGTTF